MAREWKEEVRISYLQVCLVGAHALHRAIRQGIQEVIMSEEKLAKVIICSPGQQTGDCCRISYHLFFDSSNELRVRGDIP